MHQPDFPTDFPTISQVQDAFFRAARSGYATSCQKETISALPGSKVITLTGKDWLVKDVYFVNQFNQTSFGTTTIWYRSQPIWFMSYYGRYAEEVIPFLKQVLRDTYTKGEWMGGRGPLTRQSEDGEYVYENNIERYSFSDFHGVERILSTRTGLKMGWHKYEGFLLR